MSSDEGCIIQLVLVIIVVLLIATALSWAIDIATSAITSVINFFEGIWAKLVEFFENLELPSLPPPEDTPPDPGKCEYVDASPDAGNLSVGGNAFVQNTGNTGLACRTCPGDKGTAPELWLDNDIIVSVLDGPVSTNFDNWIWWQVSVNDKDICWAAEGNGSVSWLSPIEQEWCSGELDAVDLGGGKFRDRNYFVFFREQFYPGDDARIYYDDAQKDFTYWDEYYDESADENVHRWGVSTAWAYLNRGWLDDSRWHIEYRCSNYAVK